MFGMVTDFREVFNDFDSVDKIGFGIRDLPYGEHVALWTKHLPRVCEGHALQFFEVLLLRHQEAMRRNLL